MNPRNNLPIATYTSSPSSGSSHSTSNGLSMISFTMASTLEDILSASLCAHSQSFIADVMSWHDGLGPLQKTA